MSIDQFWNFWMETCSFPQLFDVWTFECYVTSWTTQSCKQAFLFFPPFALSNWWIEPSFFYSAAGHWSERRGVLQQLTLFNTANTLRHSYYSDWWIIGSFIRLIVMTVLLCSPPMAKVHSLLYRIWRNLCVAHIGFDLNCISDVICLVQCDSVKVLSGQRPSFEYHDDDERELTSRQLERTLPVIRIFWVRFFFLSYVMFYVVVTPFPCLIAGVI